MSNLIDYAGLFPPAKLDMPTTVRNYADYLSNPEAWMLGRLLVPAGRMDEFERCAGSLFPHDDDADLWRLSCLTAPAGERQLNDDLQRIALFNDQHAVPVAGLAMIDVIELRADSAQKIDDALNVIPDELFAFFELPIEDDPRGLIAALAGGDAGAKVRMGGVTADATPAPPPLARFIGACASANVPFKATAGLHHPIRHHEDSVGARTFGFLNVFVGACLAHELQLDQGLLADLLDDESSSSFRFDAEGLAWREHRLSHGQITNARDHFAVSFGSCSFDEPRDGLRDLKLL
ncbi:MAG: hypothetical protein V3T53_03820 [Phycisphaerales bacterium]